MSQDFNRIISYSLLQYGIVFVVFSLLTQLPHNDFNGE